MSIYIEIKSISRNTIIVVCNTYPFRTKRLAKTRRRIRQIHASKNTVQVHEGHHGRTSFFTMESAHNIFPCHRAWLVLLMLWSSCILWHMFPLADRRGSHVAGAEQKANIVERMHLFLLVIAIIFHVSPCGRCVSMTCKLCAPCVYSIVLNGVRGVGNGIDFSSD